MRDYVNLLPPNYRLQCLVRQRLRQWSVLWATLMLALAAGWIDRRAQWETALENVEMHEQRYDQVRSLKREIARLRQEKLGLGKQQALVTRLQQAPPPLLPVALVSASAARCQGRVAVERVVYDEQITQPAAAPPLSAGATAAPGTKSTTATAAQLPSRSARLTIDGIGTDNIAIAEFVLGLRESGVFDRVDLKSAAANTSRVGNIIACQVECGL